MITAEALARVPWTRLWGRFGESARSPWLTLSPRFLYWTCARPGGRKCLTRDSCADGVNWRPTSSIPVEPIAGD